MTVHGRRMYKERYVTYMFMLVIRKYKDLMRRV